MSTGAEGTRTDRGPVVLCTILRAGLEGLSSLPAALAALAPFARATLDPSTGGAARYALGTGEAIPDVRAALAERIDRGNLLEAPALEAIAIRAENERGSGTDFFTQKEHPRCAIHLILTLSDVSGHAARPSIAVALIEELAARELPFVVHAICDGPDRTAADALQGIEDRLGASGRIGTVIGRDEAMGLDLGWDRALRAYRAIARDHEGAVSENVASVVLGATRAGIEEASIPPTRIGDYAGVRGSLEADFSSAAPTWAWKGSDVGIIVCAAGEELVRLTSLLLRDGVPDDVAAKLTMRDRPVYTFDGDTLSTIVRVGATPIGPVVETSSAQPCLVERLAAANKRAATVFVPSERTLATFTFDGHKVLPGGLCDRHEEADAASAIVRARDLVEARASDFVHVAVGKVVDDAAADEALAALVSAVLSVSGTLFLVVEDASTLVVAKPDAAPARAGDAPRLPRHHREIFAAVLDACGLDDQARAPR